MDVLVAESDATVILLDVCLVDVILLETLASSEPLTATLM
jgi:hypothetical protein